MEAGRGVSERCWDSWSKSLEGISAQSYEHLMRFNEEMSSLSSTGVQVLPRVWGDYNFHTLLVGTKTGTIL